MLLFALSCTDAVDKPAHILSKDQMSQVIADFAINEQSPIIRADINSENATRYILKKYNITGDAFTESYKYYMTKPSVMTKILEKAQEVVESKDPKAKDFIEKKNKQTGVAPQQAH